MDDYLRIEVVRLQAALTDAKREIEVLEEENAQLRTAMMKAAEEIDAATMTLLPLVVGESA